MRRLSMLLAFWWVGLAVAGAAPGLEIQTQIEQERDPLPFGQPATLVLDLSWDQGWNFSPPDADQLELPGLVVLDRYKTEPAAPSGRRRVLYRLLFTRLEPGPAEVPAVVFTTPHGPVRSATKKIAFQGATPLPQDQPDQLRPAKGAVPLPTADFWLRLARLLAMALPALLLLLWLGRRSSLWDRWRTPRQRALRRLHTARKRLHDGEPAEALLETVEALRHYLASAYGLVTREATSQEIARQLTMNNRCQNIKEAARAALATGDRLKFAKLDPPRDEVERHLDDLQAALQREPRRPQ